MNSDNLKNKLRRFDSHIQPAGKRSETAPAPDHYQLMAEHLGGELVSNYAGVYCLVRTRYSRQYRHGALELAPDRSLRPLTRSAFTVQAQPGRVDPSSLLFLDTETTGLGGAGAVAFLVGCGSLVDNEFEVRQYLIPDYSDETAVLEAVLTELGEDKTVVTYNGAAFDLPLLRGRMIVNRVARDIPTADHIDLLHSARRLFRRRLADCTLTNVERELFDFHRDDDVPGYLIPSIYFDWLSERRLDNMVGVLEHNRLDIVSLWFLVNHIARAFESDGASLDAADDLHSLARVYARRRDNDKVVDLYGRINELFGGRNKPDVALFHAQAFKRAGDLDQAVRLWQSICEQDGREAYWANLELAMYNEHKARDYHRAFHYAQAAARICPYGAGHRPRLNHRLQRLAAKKKEAAPKGAHANVAEDVVHKRIS